MGAPLRGAYDREVWCLARPSYARDGNRRHLCEPDRAFSGHHFAYGERAGGLADDAAAVTNTLRDAGRAWDDADDAIQDALADRDGAEPKGGCYESNWIMDLSHLQRIQRIDRADDVHIRSSAACS